MKVLARLIYPISVVIYSGEPMNLVELVKIAFSNV